MTVDQMDICKRLGGVNMLPGTWDKRMANSLSTFDSEKELSEKQNEWMFRLLYKYRAQLPITYRKHADNPFCTHLKQKQ